MINRNKKIVYLIGGSGLIGSQILKQLSKKYKILNLDIKKKVIILNILIARILQK